MPHRSINPIDIIITQDAIASATGMRRTRGIRLPRRNRVHRQLPNLTLDLLTNNSFLFSIEIIDFLAIIC